MLFVSKNKYFYCIVVCVGFCLVFVFHLSMFYFHVFTPRYFWMGLDLSNHSAMIHLRKSLYYLKKIVWIYFFVKSGHRRLSCESSLINSGYKVYKIYTLQNSNLCLHSGFLDCWADFTYDKVQYMNFCFMFSAFIFCLHLPLSNCRSLVLFGLEAL